MAVQRQPNRRMSDEARDDPRDEDEHEARVHGEVGYIQGGQNPRTTTSLTEKI